MDEPDFLRATRDSYDTVADAYAERFAGELASVPFERAMLGVFAELVPEGPVADVGCGPGWVTSHLHGLGVPAFGVDLSPRMVETARRAYPGLRFEVGSMTGLDVPDASLGGIVATYSTIHIPPERLPAVFAEFHRALSPGGLLFLAFQTGPHDAGLRLTEALGHSVSLRYYWRDPATVATLLADAGLDVRASLVREPEQGERTPRGFLLARRPGGG